MLPTPVRADRRARAQVLRPAPGPVGWPQPGTQAGPGSLAGGLPWCVRVPSAGSWGPARTGQAAPGPREPPRGPPAGAGKRWDPGRCSSLWGLTSPGLPCVDLEGRLAQGVCVCRAALGTWWRPEAGQGQGLLRAWRCLGGRAGPGPRCSATGFTTAEPPLCPHRGVARSHCGCPGLPTSCLGGADPELHARTLRAVVFYLQRYCGQYFGFLMFWSHTSQRRAIFQTSSR